MRGIDYEDSNLGWIDERVFGFGNGLDSVNDTMYLCGGLTGMSILNISNPDFTMENFAKQVNLSRTQLHKKLKSLIGNSATEYVKTLRIKKAAILLKNQSHNVIEAAFAVGFKDASYFTRSFKKQFGKTPKEFINS